MQTITPFLWFDDQAEEAANLYVSVLGGRTGSSAGRGESKILDVTRYSKASAEAGGRPERSVMTVSFMLDGQEFVALNGGPQFPFSEAVSFVVNCESQEEVDELWDKLSAGGEQGPCGWLKDRFGLSWQIVPEALTQMLSDPRSGDSQAALQAMLKMKKLDIAGLERAYNGSRVA